MKTRMKTPTVKAHVQTSIVWLFLFVLISESGAAPRKWNKKMQELGVVLSDILPEIHANKLKPASIKKLRRNTKKLEEYVHNLQLQPGKETLLPPDADPTLPMISNLLERELKRANYALNEGYGEYARGILRNVTGFCIACHSRTNAGPDFPGINLAPDTNSLSMLEKAQLLAATRQFDAAIDEYQKIISDNEFAKKKQIEWQKAVTQSLMLSVRVKQNPDEALKIIERVLKLPAALFVKEYARTWKESVLKWKTEVSRTITSEDGMHEELKSLFNEGRLLQKYPMDHAGDIYFLRATNMGHDLLRGTPNGKHAAETMLLLGRSYEVLNDPNMHPIHEMYYESCIRKAPHTNTSGECYKQLEASIYFGYSGSGGSFVPPDIDTFLAELKIMAKPNPTSESEKAAIEDVWK